MICIGCVDACVPPDAIMQVEAGNMLVQRNVANMMVNADTNLLPALQYGVSYLKVKHFIVCGHSDCGGVKEKMTSRHRSSFGSRTSVTCTLSTVKRWTPSRMPMVVIVDYSTQMRSSNGSMCSRPVKFKSDVPKLRGKRAK